jgi:hypothetical protein
MSDWTNSPLRTVYARQRQYRTNGTIQRLHQKLTEEIEFVGQGTETDAGAY